MLSEKETAINQSHSDSSDRWKCQKIMYQYDYLWLTLKNPFKIYLKKMRNLKDVGSK